MLVSSIPSVFARGDPTSNIEEIGRRNRSQRTEKSIGVPYNNEHAVSVSKNLSSKPAHPQGTNSSHRLPTNNMSSGRQSKSVPPRPNPVLGVAHKEGRPPSMLLTHRALYSQFYLRSIAPHVLLLCQAENTLRHRFAVVPKLALPLCKAVIMFADTVGTNASVAHCSARGLPMFITK